MKNERVYLRHVQDAIDDLRAYASVGEEAFLVDRMRQDAIIRKLEIIGEAVQQLSEETRGRRREVPWRQVAGMRDRLTHGYFGVDLGLVWRVVERDLEHLRTAISALLADTGGNAAEGE
ncbi:MAG: DUF86 domain-containing protein [Vicinamibacterales bacterium]